MVDTIISKFNDVWLLSDLHFGVRSNSLEWSDNQLSYFKNFFIPLLKKNKKENDICAILGDVYDNRQNIDIYISNVATDVIEMISEIMPVHIICGNHDLYKKNDTDVNSLRSFKTIQNVHVYEVPTILYNGEKRILLLPWLGEGIDENILSNNTFDYIFAHSDIQGFKYDNGKDITKGLNLQGVNVKRVYSGHIHKRQEVNSWVYIGSPYHTKRSDIGNTKGVYCLHTDKNEHSFYENNFSPVFKKIHLSNLLDLHLYQLKHVINNNYVYVIIPQEFINLFSINKFIDIIKDCNYKSITPITDKNSSNELNMLSVDNSDSKTIIELLNEAIENNLESEDEINELKLINLKYYELANKEE